MSKKNTMISDKGILACKFLLVFLVSLVMVVSGGMKVRCLEREREALLGFKEGLIDEYDILETWGTDEECCKWYGVVCSNSTGNVISLQLNADYYHGVLRVQWKGQKREYRRTPLGLLKLIDFSSNRLIGSIPKSFSSMRELISLNLSRNNLSGNIVPNIGQMELLESLDLSQNQLTGKIPTSMEQLHRLAVLDLSNNNLFGKIPTSTQLQSFDISSYAGNDGLCGPPLTLCPQDQLRPPTTNRGGNTSEKADNGFWSLSFMQEFGISMGFGFIVGFWGVVGSFIIKKSWKHAYFNFLDAVGDWFYLKAAIYLSKF